jgi:hypothetical protein
MQAHHEDIHKPLDVVWLCPRCHGQADNPRYGRRYREEVESGSGSGQYDELMDRRRKADEEAYALQPGVTWEDIDPCSFCGMPDDLCECGPMVGDHHNNLMPMNAPLRWFLKEDGTWEWDND